MLPDAPRCPVACPEEDKVDCGRRQREEWRVECSFLHGKKFSFSAEWKSCWLHFSLNRDFKSFVDLTLEGNWVLCLRTNRFWLSSHIYSRPRIIFTRVGFSNEIRDPRSRWEHCERCVVDGSSHRTIWTTRTVLKGSLNGLYGGESLRWISVRRGGCVDDVTSIDDASNK